LCDKFETDVIDTGRFKKILAYFKVTLEDFEEYYNSEDNQLKDVLQYDSKSQKLYLK
jgi:hypothetical protein